VVLHGVETDRRRKPARRSITGLDGRQTDIERGEILLAISLHANIVFSPTLTLVMRPYPPHPSPVLQCLLRWGVALVLMTSLGAQAQALKRLELQPVSARTWFVQGQSAMGSAANENFISNAGVVVGDKAVMVVDALGSPHLATLLIEAIRRITPLPITHVVVTHHHADHIYGLQVFKAQGAQVLAHASASEYIHSDTARLRLQASREELFPWIDETTRVVGPDVTLDKRRVIDLGGVQAVLLHAGPAHTPEDVMVQVPSEGVLFAGDLVFRGRVPYVGQADSAQWVAALEQLLSLKPNTLVPGHGPLSRQPQEDLRQVRDYLKYLRQAMGEAAANLEPFDEAYARADWRRFEAMPLFQVVNRMNAYNTYLLMERQPSK
jgi:glyoxylase-like metal-dependent hydrolase (beta-lactamase superfamily II)